MLQKILNRTLVICLSLLLQNYSVQNSGLKQWFLFCLQGNCVRKSHFCLHCKDYKLSQIREIQGKMICLVKKKNSKNQCQQISGSLYHYWLPLSKINSFSIRCIKRLNLLVLKFPIGCKRAIFFQKIMCSLGSCQSVRKGGKLSVLSFD